MVFDANGRVDKYVDRLGGVHGECSMTSQRKIVEKMPK